MPRIQSLILCVALTGLLGCGTASPGSQPPDSGSGNPGSSADSGTSTGPQCGDSVCDPDESCGTCESDCGACCGNGTCDDGETCSSCASDCSCSSCGNQECDNGETCSSCAGDCGACCGNGTCGLDESCSTCAADCGACTTCGNGVCDPNEACDSCAQDCGACELCGDGQCTASESCDTCPSDCSTNCCTPQSAIPPPPASTTSTATCAELTGCGGAIEGRWGITDTCASPRFLLPRVYAACNSAQVTVTNAIVNGSVAFGGGNAKFDLGGYVEATVVLPNNCSFCACDVKEQQMEGPGYSVSCSPVCSGGSCFCTVRRSIDVETVQPYSVDAGTLTTADGDTYAFCRNGTGLELAERVFGTQYVRHTLEPAADSPEVCDGFDDDFDGTPDDGQLDCAAECERPIGVCAQGYSAACGGLAGWQCTYTSPQWESTEASCDGLDNDCDGQADENVSTTQLADNQNGVCSGAVKTCGGSAGWSRAELLDARWLRGHRGDV